jgi:hypothetical protein
LNPRRILALAAALAAVASAVAVTIVAASFAVYALAREWLGPAGGAAVVAGVFAVVAAVVALLALRRARLPKPSRSPEATPVEKAMALARAQPLIAVGAAVAAGVVLMRNPALVTAVVSAFLAGGAGKPEK